MTDDELQRAWIAGASWADLAVACGMTRGAMSGRIRRMRRKEGEERWPRRKGAVAPPAKPPKPKPVGRGSTLPPLASLR